VTGRTIRESGPADIPVLAALHGECFPDDPWDATAMAEVLAMPGAFGLLSLDAAGTLPTGLLVALDLVVEFEIVAFGVRPAARRQGIGRALLAHLLGVAARRPVLLEVAEDNVAARALYGEAGFLEVGNRPAYYRRRRGPTVAALTLRRPPLP
jgi:ribosomal-protein-alanine N-acetyltransferase